MQQSKPGSGNPSSRLAHTLVSLHAMLILLLLASCSSISPREITLPVQQPEKAFKADIPKKMQEFATPSAVRELTPSEQFRYRLGPGDVINIQVWRRPELSQENIIVSPDGNIAVPRIGLMNVLYRTPAEIQQMVTSKLEVLYIKPEVTIRVQEFHNNKAFVLGRVTKPGVINFPGRGTLLEALALAGGLPYHGKETFLTKCAIIRGNDTVIWIDLQDLLKNGNMALNASIMNNDVIFIPEAEDEMVYVMGEVITPGAIQLKSNMNVLKAIMLAGGMNKRANPEKIFIIRQQDLKGNVISVNLKHLLEKGDFAKNYTLMPEDIIFVSPGGMAKFNYTLEKLVPALQVLNLGIDNFESFGLMQELRKKLWGQEGFVNSSE
ncbi:MAG: polysaccharide biosynthesis/export family protein [Chlorobi bacterium]|uniref:SLBB domain-containing protein n=1 Tax=Chlorobium sp. TaxID=1095 RepID=UPI002F404F8C|nr:polysaccharide biosynthesis/export family protein [Chlorobiota bacterium]